jgi:uncharacterized membrane protein YesL
MTFISDLLEWITGLYLSGRNWILFIFAVGLCAFGCFCATKTKALIDYVKRQNIKSVAAEDEGSRRRNFWSVRLSGIFMVFLGIVLILASIFSPPQK